MLGHVIPAGGGIEDGEQVLDILARHPSTAHFISKELAQRFVADNPPEALVNRMAQTFLATNGSIREVMKTMLNSKEFWSQGAYRAKVKSPFEMVASSARALDANVIDGWALANQVGRLGEPLYRKLEPTGYSNLNSEWVNSASLLGRMNFALQLAQNHVESVKVDVKRFGDDPNQVAKALMFRDMSPQTRAAIDKALEDKKQKNPALAGRSGHRIAGFPKEVNANAIQTCISERLRAGDVRRRVHAGLVVEIGLRGRSIGKPQENPGGHLPARRCGWLEHGNAVRRIALLRSAAVHRHPQTRRHAKLSCRPGWLLRPASLARAAKAACSTRGTWRLSTR